MLTARKLAVIHLSDETEITVD